VSDKFRVRHFAYTVPLAVIAFLIVLYGYLPESFFQLDLKKKLVEISYYRSLHICAHMQLNIFLCAGMMLFSKLITITKSKLEKVFSILMIVFLYVLILSTQARVGIVNASVVLVFIILRFTIKKLKYLIPTIAVLLTLGLGMALFLLSDNPIKKDIPVLNRTNPREFIWQDGVDLIKESPLLGVGAGTNALRVKEKLLADEQLCSMEWFLIMHLKKEHVFGMHTHNQIMQSWQEYGIIGLVAILALWGSVIWASRRSLTLNVIFLVILVQLITEVIDGGVTSIGFCFYIYLILLLLNSGEVGRDKKLLD
jgi:O-antigen ligase